MRCTNDSNISTIVQLPLLTLQQSLAAKPLSESRYMFQLTLYALIKSFFWFDTINLGSPINIYRGVTGFKFQMKYCISFSEYRFCPNGVDRDEIPHCAVSSLFAREGHSVC